MTPLADAEGTAGQLSAVEVTVRKGMEPPPHVHTREDEAVYVLAGEFTFWVGEETFAAPAGTFVWLPRGVSHAWTIAADGGRALFLTCPGGFLEAIFQPFSEPAATLDLPPVPANLPVDEMLTLDRQLGVEYSDLPG